MPRNGTDDNRSRREGLPIGSGAVESTCKNMVRARLKGSGMIDEDAGRYRGLRAGERIEIPDADEPGLLVKPEVARKQLDAEAPPKPAPTDPVRKPKPDAPNPTPPRHRRR